MIEDITVASKVLPITTHQLRKEQKFERIDLRMHFTLNLKHKRWKYNKKKLHSEIRKVTVLGNGLVGAIKFQHTIILGSGQHNAKNEVGAHALNAIKT